VKSSLLSPSVCDHTISTDINKQPTHSQRCHKSIGRFQGTRIHESMFHEPKPTLLEDLCQSADQIGHI